MGYMFCGKKEAASLVQEAASRIPSILEEFEIYFRTGGRLGIVVEAVFHGVYWSVPAALTWDNEVIRRYDSFDLLELDLLNTELGVMMKGEKTL